MSAFPPTDLESFLRCCAGEWLAVRSRFAHQPSLDSEGEGWHSSDRGAVVVAYLEAEDGGGPGGLLLTPPSEEGAAAASQRILFASGGGFVRQRPEGTGLGQGTWAMAPDGSLELREAGEQGVVRERIWFTKPNLRLRSSVERRPDGTLGRASFSSEIRRVSRAAP